MSMKSSDPRVQGIVDAFEQLAPADVARLGTWYHEDACFKDPFNEVVGLAAIQRIFAHMFERLEAPRFVIRDTLVQGDACFLSWDFSFGSGPRRITVRGASHLVFGADGRVARHRDYWDAAEELYEKLPLLGALMRWLRRRVKR